MNTLYYGDNLTIMRDKLMNGSVDLIYLDPPFNSNRNYNLMYRNMTGQPIPEQVEAFCDAWSMTAEKEEEARQIPELLRETGVSDEYLTFWRYWISSLRDVNSSLMAYLIYMVPRLCYMKGLLNPKGSIYLHCDPTVSHYIKVMMDGIFGHKNFRNEIIWKRTSAHNSAKRWGPIYDIILFYTVTDNYTWNRTTQELDDEYIENFYKYKDVQERYSIGDLTGAGVRFGDSGKPWKNVDPTEKGRHWALPSERVMPKWVELPNDYPILSIAERLDILDGYGLIYWPDKDSSVPRFKKYLTPESGVPAQDIITDIRPISAKSKDRLGYPTQKPVELLKRIILASSNEGGVVFDPFCGCGSTIYAAEHTERKWIGCDIAILAIKLVKEVLHSKHKRLEGTDFEVKSIPNSVESAADLANRDRFQFQNWIIEKIGGFPMLKKVADRGIDGRMYFETRDGLREMVLSVKSGHIKPSDIRDLRGVLEREINAEMAGFLCLEEPTVAMKQEAASAGIYEYAGNSYPRLQILTAQQILEEKRGFLTPTKVASKAKDKQQLLNDY